MKIANGIGYVLFACVVLSGQDNWHDPSPHRTQSVSVEDGIQVELLDWGGTGRPLVLLGGYSTAHIFYDIAPKLTRAGHVYGITRRGLGVSTKPDHGYTRCRKTIST